MGPSSLPSNQKTLGMNISYISFVGDRASVERSRELYGEIKHFELIHGVFRLLGREDGLEAALGQK